MRGGENNRTLNFGEHDSYSNFDAWTKIIQILSISFLDDSFPNFNGGSILTGGEIPARVRDALLGVQHGEQLEGVRRPWYEVAEHVRHSVRRYDACFRIPCVAETLHP